MTVEIYFLFGTLRYLPVLEAVLGDKPDVVSARLANHGTYRADGQVFPILVPETGANADGLLLRTDAAGAARLDLYERGFDYLTEVRDVETAHGVVRAKVYIPPVGVWYPAESWSLASWSARYGALTVQSVPEVLENAATVSTEAQKTRYAMLMARADSHLRARAAAVPATLRRPVTPDDVVVANIDRPYVYYFGVEVADLQFRRFNGELSQVVRRAAFVMADAVTILPYDPVRDTVMLVEQFRVGPYLRGDKNPWMLEPIAGRIDAGEAPETAARREAMEEAGLALQRLISIGQTYPSPGAVTEHLYNYIGLANLPPDAAGIGGLESEDEDIRAHILSFETLMELIDSGEAQNGPLVASSLWLARHRAALRAGIAAF
jgi:ADP-ribose pyrophosphatase